jgi:hypothetical protein
MIYISERLDPGLETRCRGGWDGSRVRATEDPMKKLLVMVVSTIGSAIGWWIGARIGIMSAFMLSMVGLGVGIWGGARLAARWGV